ncbi:MAG TPA: tetratricopeptide repeat protein [Terriglobales bacterium]|jgi:tetratricopeptide (TPR) repeat protein|nr:tetratricopeptide repeat protein [Terriglobales bacterium]
MRKMKITAFVIGLLVAVLCGSAFGQEPTTSELLQKGIYLQETVGDFDGAMKVYRQILQMARESRANAAQAEYRLGMCLLKKGRRAEATETFQRLLKEYPEQTDIVTKTRKLLPKENCVSFNPATTKVEQIGNDWKLVDGSKLLFDFDVQETAARRTLEIIQHYHMDRSCFVGEPGQAGPLYGFHYMLASGNSPVGAMAGEDCIGFNPATTTVTNINNQWKVVDGQRWMVGFEDNQSMADQTLEIIKKYGFTQSCYVNRDRPTARFTYMKKLYPKETARSSRAGKGLSGYSAATAPISRPGELKLLSVPWKDGEVLEYTTRKKDDSTSFQIWRSFQSSKTNTNHWLFEEHTAGHFDRVEFDPQTMQPKNLFSATAGHTFQLSYQAHTAQIVEGDGKPLAPITLDGPVFDAREIPAILPRLPWAKGYKITLPIFWSSSGRVVNSEFTVTGEENIKVPAGGFHCYRIEENDLSDQMFALETFWISTDAARVIVRNDRGDWTGELAVLPESDPEENIYRDEEAGVAFMVPAGWKIEKPPRGELFVRWYLTDLHSSAFVTLDVFPDEAGDFTPEQLQSEVQKSLAENNIVTVRPESWRTWQIAGHTVASCIEDLSRYRQVRYQAWVRTGSSAAGMFAYADPQSLNALRPTFDAIIDSLVIK